MILPKRESVKNVAALHQQEGMWRVLIASLKGGGEVEIKAAESVPASGAEALAGLIQRHGGVDLVIRVLPPGCTVARVCALPDAQGGTDAATPAAMADALTLIAESELPASLPAYRRAAGLINASRGVGRKAVGLLTGWAAGGEQEAGRAARIAPEVCISEAAALAVLAQLVGGVERAWTVDRAGGAMTILAAGPEKTVVRIARVPAGDTGTDARRNAINETSRAAGLGAAEPRSGSGWVVLEPAPASPRVAGTLRTSDWLSQFGLAAAAIAAYADPSPAVASLVGLHELEPKAKPPVLQRVSELLGAPRRAAAIIAACVIVAVVVPIGVAMARVKILEKQIPDAKALMAENSQGSKEAGFYKQLLAKRWPMTKLLADVANSCPSGVMLDSVEITQGEGVVMRGTADDTDKVTTFREHLRQSKVFSDATAPSLGNKPDGGVTFQITAKVAPGGAVYLPKSSAELAAAGASEHASGDPVKPSTRSNGSSRADRNSSRTDRRNTNDSRTNRPSSRDSSRDSSARTDRTIPGTPQPAAPKQPIPPPISDADIAKLTIEQCVKEFPARKAASSQAGLDEATKRRLLDEYEKIKEHKKQLEAAGGGK